MEIKIDFSEKIGRIKPMHGVGQPPFFGVDFSMCDRLRDAHIPFSRLHDVGGAFGGNLFVDIPNIFRDFSADENSPESYDFAFTDLLISALVLRGIEPFFRLGVTIENYRTVRAYRINPPEDYGKWARICEHIVRHYTEGWANGFCYKISYWEIWNEPDNYETPEENQMWTGSAADYYRLYEVASKHLKACFPHLKIGGYASCGFYSITGSDNTFAACSPRFDYFVEFFEGFLEYIKAHGCPLDFFSWHSYSTAADNVRWASFVRDRLDSAGYADTEHTLNEWNWEPHRKGSARHAALTGGMMLALQDTSLNSAMFYDGACNLGIYGGLFEPVSRTPLPAYYAALAFGELYALGTQCRLTGTEPEIYAVAARDLSHGAAAIANTGTEETALELSANAEITEVRIITRGKTWEEVPLPRILPGESLIFVRFKL